MKVGIKYCGGCNCRYDRAKEVKKLITAFPDHEFTYEATPENICDIWLIVCGCITACAAYSDLVYIKRIFIIHRPQDFIPVVSFLQQETAVSSQRTQKELVIGTQASMTKQFTAGDLAAFARLTEDFGKLHTDPVFAAQYGFGTPVLHGVLTASLLSSVMGMQLPGDGTILMEENITFLQPAYVNDTITATITLEKVEEQKRYYIVSLSGECRNQHGDIIITGTFRQLAMKNLFTHIYHLNQ